MNVIKIPAIGKKVEYPSEWWECSPEQLKGIFREVLWLTMGKMELQEFKIRMFYFLAGIVRTESNNRKDRLLTREQQTQKYTNIVRAADTIDFMFSEREGQTVFDFNCIKNMLPEIRIRTKKLYGPSDALLNLTFGEYRVASDFFRRFVDDREEAALDNLCAVLYRPERTGKIGNDIRVEFNPNDCVRGAGKFRHLPFEVKYIIFSWFSACDNYLKSGDLQIEGHTINLRCLFKADTGEKEVGLGLTGILMSVADTGTFGPIREVDRTNLYTVFLRLYLWHQENERIKKMYKNDKSENL